MCSFNYFFLQLTIIFHKFCFEIMCSESLQSVYHLRFQRYKGYSNFSFLAFIIFPSCGICVENNLLSTCVSGNFSFLSKFHHICFLFIYLIMYSRYLCVCVHAILQGFHSFKIHCAHDYFVSSSLYCVCPML